MTRTTRWFLGLLSVSLLLSAAVIAAVALTSRGPQVAKGSILRINLGGSWPDATASGFGSHFGPSPLTLSQLVDAIEAAGTDDDIAGIEMRVGLLDVGWAKAQEVRQALLDFRGSGKPVRAFLEYGDDGTYFIASAADKVRMIESGTLWLDGISTEVEFYGGTLAKVGVQADLEQIGDYKNAADVMKRDSMTPAHREAMNGLLDGLFQELVAGIAQSRGRSEDEIRDLVSKGPYTAHAALAAGLIDAVGYEDETSAEIDAEAGGARSRVGLRDYVATLRPESGDTTIAIIDCVGAIVPGESSSGLLGGSSIGSDTIAQAIAEARRVAGVKALILRVDSPGGSPVASDVIYRATQQARAAGLPVVVSMSDVAASGGYWISMGADRVFAEPSTLTGSIGIFGGKYVTRGLMDKAAIHVEPLKRGDRADINSSLAPFTPDQRAWMQAELMDTYRLFIERTASGRGFHSAEEVDRIARGHVWTGRQAKERGLVDELGGLREAIAAARELGHVGAGEKVALRHFPRNPGLLEMLMRQGPSAALGSVVAQAAREQVESEVPPGVRNALASASLLERLQREGAVVYLPLRVLAR